MYPDVRFNIKFEESDVLLDLLNKGRLDLALIDFFSPYDQLPGKPDIYKIDPLMLENFIMACSKEYYEKRIKGDLSYEHLSGLDFMTDENEPIILNHWFWFYFKKSMPKLNMVMAIEAHQALMACIRNGMGLAVTSLHLFEKQIAQKEIIPVFPSPKKLINTISMVCLKDGVPTVAQGKFQTYLRARFNDRE